MIDSTNVSQPTHWQSHPLCSRYLSVHFKTLLMRERGVGSVRAVTACWALGALADGQLDMLGVWIDPSGSTNWSQVFEELRDRGVERIRLVVTAEPIAEPLLIPVATVLPSVEAYVTLTPRLRRILFAAAEAAGRAQTHLARAVGRHGCFDDRGAAFTFLMDKLRIGVHDLTAHQTGSGSGSSAAHRVRGIRAGVEGLCI